MNRPRSLAKRSLRMFGRCMSALGTSRLWGLLAMALMMTATVSGQQPSSVGKRKLGSVETTGSWRLRVEGWDWFELTPGHSSYTFPHSLLRVSLGQTRGNVEWRIEAAQTSILALPEDAVAAPPQGQLGLGGTYFAANGNRRNNAGVFAKQAYLRFQGLGKGNLLLGRFEYTDGTELIPDDPTLAALARTRIAQRLIGNFGWSAVGRSLDGAQFTYNLGSSRLTLLGGRPTRGSFQTDANAEVDIDLFYGAYSVPLAAPSGSARLRLFSAGYLDHRTQVLKTDNRSAAVRAADRDAVQIGTYGADYIQVINTAAQGKFNFLVWSALQTGAWGGLDHRAAAVVGEVGWQPPVKFLSPWLSAGYSLGSGDGDPNDLRHGTFFQILPTPRPYARFPFYNMENNEDFYASLQLRPNSKLSLRSELHALRLNERLDLWYQGGGPYQELTFGYAGRPSGGSRGLANVWDLSADYQATTAFGVSLYYARAWGKTVIRNIYPENPSGQFVYVESNVRF